jgi:Ca2+-binding EF-hand superfamily protein
MKTALRLFLSTLAVSAAVKASAAQPDAAPATDVRPVASVFAALDLDRDGLLSPREIAVSPVTLGGLDNDGDGFISAVELRGARSSDQGRIRREASAFTVTMALDANHDGELQPLEVANAVSSLRQLDRNQDGSLTAVELRPVLLARATPHP